MRFRRYDNLRSFCEVARHSSFTGAADALSLTKGAISHQIDNLEDELGFELFHRRKSGISLTRDGDRMLRVAKLAFASIEQEVSHLQRRDRKIITIGMATYFASRWLSPRLMRFITEYPGIGLRIQPVVGNPDLQSGDLDMAIRWGKGEWSEPGLTVEKVFTCPAMLTASADIGRRIETHGIKDTIEELNLLHDADGSHAWSDWFHAAELSMPQSGRDLMIPDPNVRVQAVIDGQGLALYDELVYDEVERGRLYFFDNVRLVDYGYYLVYPENARHDSPVVTFRNWIISEAERFDPE